MPRTFQSLSDYLGFSHFLSALNDIRERVSETVRAKDSYQELGNIITTTNIISQKVKCYSTHYNEC